MITHEIYLYILENKKNWISLSGGISNNVYKFNNKYIIKIINKLNDNLFLSLTNYNIILEKFDTTLYLDKINNIIIEKYIEGEIVPDYKLYEQKFCHDIFKKIDTHLYLSNYPIDKNNVIKLYIGQLSNYIEQNNLANENYFLIKNLITPNIINLLENDEPKLYFSHCDIQKYNIIIDKNNQINFIDYEYSGYTWKYFDHVNFIILLFNEAISNQKDKITVENIKKYFNFDFYKNIILSQYTDITLEYFNSMCLISLYTWYLWSIVKSNINFNQIYLTYAKQINKIIDFIIFTILNKI